MDMKKAVVLIALVLALPQGVSALELNKDLRLKYGFKTPGLKELDSTVAGASALGLDDQNGDNYQLEAAFSPVRTSPISGVFGFGAFMRSLPGKRPGFTAEYDVKGLSVAGGLSLNPGQGNSSSAKVHIEARLEFDLGLADFKAAGVDADTGVYSATSLILGGYITVPTGRQSPTPGLQFGLELGQQWWGAANTYSTATDSGTLTAKGRGMVINLVGGIRF